MKIATVTNLIFCVGLSITCVCCSTKMDKQNDLSCFKIDSFKEFKFGQYMNTDSIPFQVFPFDTFGGINDLLLFSDGFMAMGPPFSNDGNIFMGSLIFTVDKSSRKVNSIHSVWMFSSHEESLIKLKEQFLPCLPITKMDLQKGGEYINNTNGTNEFYKLSPVDQSGNWSLNYRIRV